MKSFDQIYQCAAHRKGGEARLKSLLPPPIPSEQVALQTDDRMLSLMTRCIFQAGFKWEVVDKKWPEFEYVFNGFDPKILEFLSADDLEEFARDARIIRNMQKISTIPRNAQWINEISEMHGSFARFLSQWPQIDLIGLFQLLKKRGSRLGGNTGQRFLRMAGIDSFILSQDVILALRDADIGFHGSVASMKDMKLIQAAFHAWHKETSLPYTHLSKILAYSAGENRV
ncbi:MAG: DNA-3-methyladenine glycosylase I [Gammaproteobacteria bacterium]